MPALISKAPQSSSRRLLVLLAFFISGLAYWLALRSWLGDVLLDLGSLSTPTARLLATWSVFEFWGTLAVFFAATYFYMQLDARDWNDWYLRNRSRILWFAAILAFCIATTLRLFLLKRAPLADDETMFLLAAKSLLQGRLWEGSPPFSEFYDHPFLINNGKFYSPYFIGWSALLAPSLATGLADFINPLLCAMTIFPLARLLERYCRAPAVLGGLILYVSSFTILVTSATLLSYTAALFMILWFVELLLRMADDETGDITLAAITAAIGSMAFFIRPSAVVVIALAPAIYMIWRSYNRSQTMLRQMSPFLLTAGIFAGLFLLTNLATHGEIFTTGYSQNWHGTDKFISNYQPTIGSWLSTATAGFQRMSADVVGWPLPLLALLLLVIGPIRLWPLKVALGIDVGLYALMSDVGIDTFGPIHLLEVAGIFIVLLAAGTQRLLDFVSRVIPAGTLKVDFDRLVIATFLGMMAAAWITYYPHRLLNVAVAAANSNAPLLLAKNLPHSAMIFFEQPFIDQRSIAPLQHYVFHAPVTLPSHDEKVLWLKDLGAARNQQAIDLYPDRTAYMLVWKNGRAGLIPVKVKN